MLAAVQITTTLPKLLLKTTGEAYLSAYCPQLQETPSYQNLLPYCGRLMEVFCMCSGTSSISRPVHKR